MKVLIARSTISSNGVPTSYSRVCGCAHSPFAPETVHVMAAKHAVFGGAGAPGALQLKRTEHLRKEHQQHGSRA